MALLSIRTGLATHEYDLTKNDGVYNLNVIEYGNMYDIKFKTEAELDEYLEERLEMTEINQLKEDL